MRQFLLVTAVALLAMVSCSKKDSTTQPAELLQAGKWRSTTHTMKYKLNTDVDTVVNVYTPADTCREDDYLIFSKNYKGTQNSGSEKCGVESDAMPFDWSVTNNGKNLIMNNIEYTTGFEYVNANIKKINAQTFTITYEYTVQTKPSVAPTTFYHTQTFIKTY